MLTYSLLWCSTEGGIRFHSGSSPLTFWGHLHKPGGAVTMTVRARSTPNPSPTRSTVNFCKQERRVLFVLKPSRPYPSGLGGLTGTDPGLATPKISTPMTLLMVPPHPPYCISMLSFSQSGLPSNWQATLECGSPPRDI